MTSIHPYVHTCEISIDAGVKDTYENVTRLGGNWETLLKNLEFINPSDLAVGGDIKINGYIWIKKYLTF